MALKPIREMQYAENIGNPVFITDLAVLSQNIVELKAAINMFGKTTAIIYGFDKTEGGYTPGIVLHNKQLYSYAAGDVIPANTYLHSVVQQTTPRILENGSTFNAYVEYTFIANSTSTGDDLITSEPLTDDYVAELKNAAQGIPPITTDMIADGAVTAAKLAEQYIVNRGAVSDLNKAVTYGFYTYDATTQNTPTSYGSVIVVEGTGRSGNWIQLALGYSADNVNPSVFVRFRQSLESWSDWVKVWKSNDFNPDDKFGFSAAQLSDLNNAPNNAFFVGAHNAANAPVADSWCNGFTIAYGNNPYFRKQFCYAGDKWWTRGRNGTTWSAWSQIWDSGNFTPSSFAQTKKETFPSGGIDNITDSEFTGNIRAHFPGEEYSSIWQGEDYQGTILQLKLRDHANVQSMMYRGNKTKTWRKVWDSGNFTPSSFAQTKKETFPSGGIDNITDSEFTGNIRAHFPGEEYSSIWQGEDYQGTILQLKLRDHANVQSMMYRGNKTKTWRKVWDSGNFNPADYLSKENTTVYVPTGEYNPATKGYVDSAVENGSTKKVNTTNLNTLISEGTCFFQFAASTTNAPMPQAGGGLQIVLTDKIIQFVTIFYSTSYAGPSFYRTSLTASASTFSPWSCFAENSDFGRNVYFEQQLDATHFNDAPVVKKLVKGSYTNKLGPATVFLDNYASTQFPGTYSQYAPIAFRGYAKFIDYSTKATLAIVPVNSQSNNNYAFFTYVNPSSIYQVMANFTGGLATVREQVDYWVEITYGKVV